MSPSQTDENPNKKPQMGRREIGTLLLLLLINWAFVLLFYGAAAHQRVAIPYSPTFLAQVQRGNVSTVTAQDAAIQGNLKHAIRYPASDKGAKATTEFSTRVPDFANTKALDTLLQQKGVVVTAKAPPGTPFWQTLLAGFAPAILFFGLWYLIMRQSGSGSMFSFGKTKARKYEPTTERVTFADVAGIDEAKEELAEVVDFLRDPDKYRKLGAHIPRGVLLTGAPGTGKTLLARAVAGEAGVPFFSMSASEFVEMIVGVGASRVRDLFAQAKAAAPSIIFIDEIDAIGRSRSSAAYSGSNDEREQTLNQILTEMDGFDASTGVIVLAATNRPDVLDSALLRPGRFDRRVPVQAPDKPGREQILRVHTRGLPLAPDVDLDALAATTAGMVGADLANLANEAALLAARRGHEQVTMDDFSDVLEKIELGTARRLLLTPEDKRRTAYHEAGHALVGMLTPGADPVRKISIIPRTMSLGVTISAPGSDRFNYDKQSLLAHITLDRRPRRRGGRLRRRDNRRRVRHPPGDPTRPQHGRPLRNERRHRLPLRAAAGRRRLRPDARRLRGLRADQATNRRRDAAHRRRGTRRGGPTPRRPPRKPRLPRRSALQGGDPGRAGGIRRGRARARCR
jgi:cell division protease FtsH